MDINYVISDYVRRQRSSCIYLRIFNQPATPCYFNYRLNLGFNDETFESVMREHGWTLQCTVNVQDTADATYFCVVGWGPGGYSGLKQIDSNNRLAIFSMWDDDEIDSVVRIKLPFEYKKICLHYN